MRFHIPEAKKLVHETTIPIRWGDMDAMGHVNNTVYFRYFEIARLDWIYKVCGGWQGSTQGPVIVNAFCNFLRQLEFPGDVRARFYVTNPGRSSFDTYLTIERTDQPGVVWAEGGAKMVWTDYATRKSVPLPEALRAQIGP
ncbi:MAG: thioesterase family protein [Rubrivivax sp.]